MATSAFDDKDFMPDDKMLATVLGDSFAHWDDIKKHLLAGYKSITEEWKFYSKDAGWSKNIKSGKRTLFVFIPTNDAFQLYFTLGEKAVAAVKNSDLPNEIIALLPDTKQCVCGFGLTLCVKTKADADAATKLIAIKDKN